MKKKKYYVQSLIFNLEKRKRIELESSSNTSSSQTRLQNVSNKTSTTTDQQQFNQNQNAFNPSLKTLPSTSSPRKKKRGRKYTKADIGEPTNFIHVTHVGWDHQKGFDLSGNGDNEMLKTFLWKAGISNHHVSYYSIFVSY